MEHIRVLIGAEVNIIRFSYQVEINFMWGDAPQIKSADLQLEAGFILSNGESQHECEPGNAATLAPALDLLHATVTNVTLTSTYELSIEFSNGYTLSVGPVPDYEAWNLSGNDMPYIVAVGV